MNARGRLSGLLGAVLALVGAVAGVAVSTTEAEAGHRYRVGPEGGAFYHPPKRLIPGRHGSLIWARPVTDGPALSQADNWLVLYRSVTTGGETVAVSGTVAVPRGDAPDGGWPVLSWASGTTGVADVCASSKDSPDHPAHDYLGLMAQSQARWIDRGYAVLRTDYQGLGTDGVHSYLIGVAEARAVTDIALAARELGEDLSRRWVVAGHSQGGQASLFTSTVAGDWAPQLDLVGAVAMSPPSQTHTNLPMIRSLPVPDLGPFISLIIRGIQTQTPFDESALLSPRAAALMPLADSRCLGGLRDSGWAGIKSNEIFVPGADYSALDQVIKDNDVQFLRPGIPVLLAQGGRDTITPAADTVRLESQYRTRGVPVTYRYYPDADHRATVAAAEADVATWVDGLFSAAY